LGVIAQTIVGFGIAAFLIPTLFILFNPPIAISIVLLTSSVLCLIILINERHTSGLIWPVVLRLFVAAVPGLILGAYVVTHSNKGILLIAIGVLIIMTAVLQEYAFPQPTKPLAVSKGIIMSGFTAGILNSASATAPAPLVLWMRSHISTPNQIRHNLAAIFLLMNAASVPAIYFFRHSPLSLKGLGVAGLLIPVIIAGYFIGKLLVDRINTDQYKKLVLAAVMLSGVVSIGLGIQNLI
ncbi:MAG TPA: sulfite exporter TauE/SafE family protein, partial [Candidatus Polarisedimenticolaceae bacterium]|nr:sulfite exporter TauE/SafE family protein [Candidatus Polarisedimenticolaceae bacterium]